ncbi:MAG: OST-HTH/LOTUS domain-containing protein [Methylobacter sp.]
MKILDTDAEKADPIKTEQPKQVTEKQSQLSRQQLCQNAKLMNILRNAVNECSNEEGWAELGVCGSLIKRQHPDFDSRNFGYAKLSTLIETTTLFEMKKIAMKGTNTFKLFYRDKKKK